MRFSSVIAAALLFTFANIVTPAEASESFPPSIQKQKMPDVIPYSALMRLSPEMRVRYIRGLRAMLIELSKTSKDRGRFGMIDPRETNPLFAEYALWLEALFPEAQAAPADCLHPDFPRKSTINGETVCLADKGNAPIDSNWYCGQKNGYYALVQGKKICLEPRSYENLRAARSQVEVICEEGYDYKLKAVPGKYPEACRHLDPTPPTNTVANRAPPPEEEQRQPVVAAQVQPVVERPKRYSCGAFKQDVCEDDARKAAAEGKDRAKLLDKYREMAKQEGGKFKCIYAGSFQTYPMKRDGVYDVAPGKCSPPKSFPAPDPTTRTEPLVCCEKSSQVLCNPLLYGVAGEANARNSPAAPAPARAPTGAKKKAAKPAPAAPPSRGPSCSSSEGKTAYYGNCIDRAEGATSACESAFGKSDAAPPIRATATATDVRPPNVRVVTPQGALAGPPTELQEPVVGAAPVPQAPAAANQKKPLTATEFLALNNNGIQEAWQKMKEDIDVICKVEEFRLTHCTECAVISKHLGALKKENTPNESCEWPTEPAQEPSQAPALAPGTARQ